MGLIGRIKEIIGVARNSESYTEVTIDSGGGPPVTAQAFNAPGIDSKPLPEDAVYYCDAGGIMVSCATADTSQEQEAGDGEIILYARNGSGARVARIKVLSDGTIEITGDGDVTINGATIDTSGNITTASGISLDDHTHPYTNNIFTAPDGPDVPTPANTDPPT